MIIRRTLHTDLRAGESITFDNGRVVITLEKKSGRVARLRINAIESVIITPVRERQSTDLTH